MLNKSMNLYQSFENISEVLKQNLDTEVKLI